MAYNPYFKSLIWLVSLGGFGYVLLKVTQPSQEKLQRIKESANPAHLTEDEKKKLQFMKRLKEATTEAPIYLKPRKEN